MFKKQHLALAIAATLAAGSAQAALETSVTLKNETARFVKDGIRTGEATSQIDSSGEGKGIYKFENTAKIFLNDALDNGMSWHGELNIVRDSKAINDYQGHETNTQRDWLRELYVDTTAADWDLRIGKQQVVWGTADGIKLLDLINPTDWSEINQNAPADARTPIWMVNAEKYLDNGGNIQVVLSEVEANKIAGLNATGDANHPFVMKGVDTITGNVNGFLDIAPLLGSTATAFNTFANFGFFNGTSGTSLAPFNMMSVSSFAGSSNAYFYVSGTPTGFGAGDGLLAATANLTSATVLGTTVTLGGNNNVTNLMPANSSSTTTTAFGDIYTTDFDVANPTSAFEYMPNATFATFNTFNGITSSYVKDYPDSKKANLAFRFKNTTSNGLNYSVNFANRYDNNPYVDVGWYVGNTKLTVQRASTDGNLAPDLSSNVAVDDIPESVTFSGTSITNGIAVLLKDGTTYYAGADVDPYGTYSGETTNTSDTPVLRFTERLNRVNNLGGSVDFAIDTSDAPIVVRGEFLYTKGEAKPLIDKKALSIGDLTNAMTTHKTDTFKYVLGADVTVLTDMLVSGQFIQFRDLDYIDKSRTCSDANGTSFDCSRYTGDMATLSLSNGFNKAEKNKEFYSLFFSKPFGDSGEGRWNNIFIYEEGGGKWNRFDVEYGFDDQLIGTFEVNKYFGDNNTMFGQFENASNVQIGLKYLLQ